MSKTFIKLFTSLLLRLKCVRCPCFIATSHKRAQWRLRDVFGRASYLAWNIWILMFSAYYRFHPFIFYFIFLLKNYRTKFFNRCQESHQRETKPCIHHPTSKPTTTTPYHIFYNILLGTKTSSFLSISTVEYTYTHTPQPSFSKTKFVQKRTLKKENNHNHWKATSINQLLLLSYWSLEDYQPISRLNPLQNHHVDCQEQLHLRPMWNYYRKSNNDPSYYYFYLSRGGNQQCYSNNAATTRLVIGYNINLPPNHRLRHQLPNLQCPNHPRYSLHLFRSCPGWWVMDGYGLRLLNCDGVPNRLGKFQGLRPLLHTWLFQLPYVFRKLEFHHRKHHHCHRSDLGELPLRSKSLLWLHTERFELYYLLYDCQ